MRFYTDQQIENHLGHRLYEYLDYLKARIAAIRSTEDHAWAVVEPKIVYDDPLSEFGDVRPMTCFTDLVKIVKVISTNPYRKKDPCVSVGATLLLDQEENFPVAIFDAPVLSAMRTAAMATLAVEWIRPNFESMHIVGCDGRVGSHIADFLVRRFERPWELTMTDKRRNTTTKDVTYHEEVVILATDSRKPIVDKNNCGARLIVSVGADTHFNHEIDPSLLLNPQNSVYADIMEARSVGDLEGWGQIVDMIFRGDLFTMLNHLEQGLEPGIFISVGSPLMDALTIEYLVHERGILDDC